MAILGYTSVGSGPTKVIAAHTWLADHQTYSPLFPYLDAENYTFVFPDFRGYGKSKDLKGEFNVREMGQDLLAVADTLGWDVFHIVGNSMGGQAAQWLAGHAAVQDRIQSLFLVAAIPARGFPLDADGAKFFAGAASSMAVRGQCASGVTAGRLGKAFETYMARLSWQTATADAIARYLRTWAQEDVSAEIESYPGPVQVYVGQHDPFLTEDVARDGIASLFPQAKLGTLAGAAHYPPLETPVYVAALLNALNSSEVSR